MGIWVKICGITSEEDALTAVECGADAVGMVFAPSPRRIEVPTALKICKEITGGVEKVGVFVNRRRTEVESIRDFLGLDMVQLHGEESATYCRDLGGRYIKAFHPENLPRESALEEYGAFAFLFDSRLPGRRGGTGRTLDWQGLVDKRTGGRLILAGGLHPDNVGRAIEVVRPFGVDVSSGVERYPGRKDRELVKRFLEQARRTEGSSAEVGSP